MPSSIEYTVDNHMLDWIPRIFLIFNFRPHLSFWSKIKKVKAMVNSWIFTNSPYEYMIIYTQGMIIYLYWTYKYLSKVM